MWATISCPRIALALTYRPLRALAPKYTEKAGRTALSRARQQLFARELSVGPVTTCVAALRHAPS